MTSKPVLKIVIRMWSLFNGEGGGIECVAVEAVENNTNSQRIAFTAIKLSSLLYKLCGVIHLAIWLELKLIDGAPWLEQ